MTKAFSSGASAPLPFKKTASQARLCETALAACLDSAFNRGTPADKTLARVFREDRRIGSRDRALVSMSVFAVFRWWGWISPLAAGRPAEASKEACAALLLAASVAESQEPSPLLEACCADAGVEFVRVFATLSLSDRALRVEKTLLALGLPAVKPLAEEDLIPAWARGELDEAVLKPDLFAWLQRRPPIWLRAQTGDVASLCEALRAAGLNPQVHPRVAGAIRVDGVKVNLRALPEFERGLFEIQDLSSQCIGLACMPKPGESWWDACAGGGGKSLQLASLMKRKGSIRATDTRAYMLEELKKRAARAAFPNIRCSEWDGGKPDVKRRGLFDGVLIDAPCSSSGRWRRNPDARWIASPSWVDELRDAQFKIMESASSTVKPGGVLVYATCSMFRREDFDNVERFLKAHTDFALEPFDNPLSGERVEGALLTPPWAADCDASFVARLRRAS